jgi:phosphoribosyl-AMP cyclohydrolase
MVLPFLPAVENIDAIDASGTLDKTAVRAIGQVMIRTTQSDVETHLSKFSELSESLDIFIDGDHIPPFDLRKLLDSGVSRVILSSLRFSELKILIPAERVLIRLSEQLEEYPISIAGIIYDPTFPTSRPEILKVIAAPPQMLLSPTGGELKRYLDYSRTTSLPTIDELKTIASLSIVPMLPSSCLTSSPKDHPSLLSVAQLALLGANTDRQDRLYPTIVTNERSQTLGLVFSSQESIAESIRTGTGVYQSRVRGLWYKGATSGATQKLLGISWDCDSDCLCYTVKQEGKGSHYIFYFC